MQKLKFLDNPDLQFILFGGKGGSGKTTSAAATALHLSKMKPEKKILVISIDPAHSLGDSFDLIIGNKITPIAGNIWGYEIDAEELLKKYKAENGAIIKKMAERGTFFDQEDIENFFVMSMPGLDEVMAIIKIANILNSREYDVIILDTAPTGHTTVFLSLPEKMLKWVEVADMMMEKHRYMARRFVGKYVKDECDEFLESQKHDVGKVRKLLTDSKTTEFVPVTIPEPMSIYEIERLVQLLENARVPVNSVIANRIIIEDSKCHFCLARKKEQEKYVKEIEEKFACYNLLKMPLFPREIRGIEDLTLYGEILFGEDGHLSEIPSLPQGGMEDLLEKNLKLIIFGGKGGVGKTSIASAAALQLARHNKEKKVLIFSTDPVHALSDSFDQQIGNEPHLVQDGTDNLYALELDASQMLNNLKEEYRGDIVEVFDKFASSGMDIKFDKEVMEELITLTPPGLEELMALKKIVELMKTSDYDLFIMDSAASGHLLRFLETPNIVREWLKTVFRLLMKYKGVINLSRIHSVESLLDLSRDVRKIQETLANPETTEFVMITIPEEMGIREMVDLSSALRNLKIPYSHTIINMIIPLSDCNFCTAKRQEQQKYIQSIESKVNLVRSKSPEVTAVPLARTSNGVNNGVIYIPLFLHGVRGKESLNELAEIIFSKGRQNG
ncbi:ArsA family ATPase [bacterium]|nr:ArsA family ATPase [bacterium]